ncbi:hypothetical protein NIES2104_65980 [Leptolyngbya sp. NIES-2104]|nr:hypothetical protein NIES2104_65980 [Leptolyngbya sp. NIES-2104]
MLSKDYKIAAINISKLGIVKAILTFLIRSPVPQKGFANDLPISVSS